MGTFHDDLGELHGITVVVDTHGPAVWIGRCHEQTDQGILLLDVDGHEEGRDGLSKTQWIERAARFGHWNRHPKIEVAAADIVSVNRLVDVAAANEGEDRASPPSPGR